MVEFFFSSCFLSCSTSDKKSLLCIIFTHCWTVGDDVNIVVAIYTQACRDLTGQNFVDCLYDSCRRRLSLQSRNEWLQWPS